MSDILEDSDTAAAIDVEILRAKYRQERDKRINKLGKAQYVATDGAFGHFTDDPYGRKESARDPKTDEVEVLIIGAGFSALMLAAKLREAGHRSIRITDKAGDVGGTWYWNRYPGAQCDVESYIYFPLLEETGYMPSQKYAHGPEILDHARRIATHYGLYEHALFQTQVTELHWLDIEGKWLVKTDRGDAFRAHFVATAGGPLNKARLPGIPGIESFKGRAFHTSRWDYAYTGGDSGGNLERLIGKRVAIIGTGCTAIQCAPHVGKWAKELFVFQRTPSSVDYRRNSPTDPEWVKTLKPGWQQRRRENFTTLLAGGHQDEDLVADGWTDIFRNLNAYLAVEHAEQQNPEESEARMEAADFLKMNQIRARVDEVVKDKATAEALKPWYRLFCKRPTFNDAYLDTFNRENVVLVDTNGRGVDRITENALVVDGKEYPVDCIIFATGFEIDTSLERRSGVKIYGRNGLLLDQYWADGHRTLHGFYSHGFPNLFHMGVGQNGWTVNFVHLATEQSIHIAEVLQHAWKHNLRVVEPTFEAEAAWVAEIRRKTMAKGKFYEECTPGFLNNEGKLEERGALQEQYGGGPIEFFDIIRRWRAGGMDGLRRE